MNHTALFSAVVAVAFSSVRPGLFGWWFNFLLWLETKGSAGKFIAEPLGQCEKCLAGQIALWSSIAVGCHWTQVIVNASAAILIAAVINKVYQWSHSGNLSARVGAEHHRRRERIVGSCGEPDTVHQLLDADHNKTSR